MIDYETDPRPLADCLKDFAARINDGKTYGARPKAAKELRAPEATLKGWMDGRPCGHEAMLRRLMSLLVSP